MQVALLNNNGNNVNSNSIGEGVIKKVSLSTLIIFPDYIIFTVLFYVIQHASTWAKHCAAERRYKSDQLWPYSPSDLELYNGEGPFNLQPP